MQAGEAVPIPLSSGSIMFFEIDHLTRYQYSVPVRLVQQLLHFLPRDDGGQRPISEKVEITPAPVRRDAGRDMWGNRVEWVYFDGETDQLEIRAHLELETIEHPAPLWTGDLNLPIDYAARADEFSPYLQPLEKPELLETFVQPLLACSSGYAPDFLAALNQTIHGFYHPGVRLEGAARRPAETLALAEGVCRDLSLLFMAACRQAGLAARFVSGYQQSNGLRLQRFLHAWAEVYLPTLGWLGYDPTHGSMTGAEHVAIAAAPTQAATMPLAGGYLFNGAALTSTLVTDIHISTR